MLTTHSKLRDSRHRFGNNFMSVYIDPNLKKEKAFINVEGDIINKDTKQVLEKNEVETVLPPEAVKSPEVKSNMDDKISSLIESKIASKIDEIVSKKIDEILSKL